jgi:hypothetical protein
MLVMRVNRCHVGGSKSGRDLLQLSMEHHFQCCSSGGCDQPDARTSAEQDITDDTGGREGYVLASRLALSARVIGDDIFLPSWESLWIRSAQMIDTEIQLAPEPRLF